MRRTVAVRCSPHSLRHTAATLALDAGVLLHGVQDALDHADPRTTRRSPPVPRRARGHPTSTLAAYLGAWRDRPPRV